MCLVQSWNLGFLANLIAEVLSTRRGVEFTCFSCKSSSIFLSHTISFVASTIATYFSSVVESVGTDYLCDLQETVADPHGHAEEILFLVVPIFRRTIFGMVLLVVPTYLVFFIFFYQTAIFSMSFLTGIYLSGVVAMQGDKW
jgi:hypothetical protein